MLNLKISKVDIEPTKSDLMNRAKRGQQRFGEVFLRDTNNYVPMKSGASRGSGEVISGGKQVRWGVNASNGFPYTVRQYENQFSNYTTANTGPFWDRKSKGIHYPSWVQEVEREMK